MAHLPVIVASILITGLFIAEGVTRERIRQIRERAFEKLRQSPDGRALAGFWNAA
jgi:hypothetical protein